MSGAQGQLRSPAGEQGGILTYCGTKVKKKNGQKALKF
jgi:hypothetical protein